MSIYRLTEVERRLANILRAGRVDSVDYATARCRVAIGNLLTDPLPFFADRAGDDRTWNPPSVGEQVLVLSPSGELGAGFVLCGIFSNANPANSSDQNIHRTTYSDGTIVEYDRESHTLNINQSASGSSLTVTVNGNANLSVTGNVLVEADGNATVSAGSLSTVEAGTRITLTAPAVQINSTVTVTGDVVADGISLKTHRHGGVQGGPGQTSAPV